MGAGSGGLSQVFNSCGYIPDSPCSVAAHQASASSQLAVEGRDVADTVDYERRQKAKQEGSWLCCVVEDVELVDPPRGQFLGPASVVGSQSAQREANKGMVSSAASKGQQEAFLKLEPMMKELFELQDLNKNGVLEEDELIKLNEKIAMLHHGKDTDRTAVRRHFKNEFRNKLDPNGDPVPFAVFRKYMLDMLDGMDKDRVAQELILEQFIEKARSGCMAFSCPSFYSVTDTPYTCAKIEAMQTASARSGRAAGA